MTPSQLKRLHESHDLDSYFFSRSSMKFFGDTMRNYGVCRTNVYDKSTGEKFEVWELFRKQLVKYGLGTSHYFSDNGQHLASVSPKYDDIYV
jgi:hypothetical protein